MKENCIERQSSKRETQIGEAKYIVEREFVGEKTVTELITERLLSKKEHPSKDHMKG